MVYSEGHSYIHREGLKHTTKTIDNFLPVSIQTAHFPHVITCCVFLEMWQFTSNIVMEQSIIRLLLSVFVVQKVIWHHIVGWPGVKWQEREVYRSPPSSVEFNLHFPTSSWRSAVLTTGTTFPYLVK